MSAKEKMQDALLLAIVGAAYKHRERGETDVAVALETEGARIAKRWGISEVPGLPGTYRERARPHHVMTRAIAR